MASQRSKVTVDIKQNRLNIILVGTIRKKDVESIYTDVRFCVRDLKKSYDVITDMRNCKIGFLAGAATFHKILRFLQDNNVGRIVRITGKSKTVIQQIQRLTKTVSGYSTIYVETPEEAEEALRL